MMLSHRATDHRSARHHMAHPSPAIPRRRMRSRRQLETNRKGNMPLLSASIFFIMNFLVVGGLYNESSLHSTNLQACPTLNAHFGRPNRQPTNCHWIEGHLTSPGLQYCAGWGYCSDPYTFLDVRENRVQSHNSIILP